MTKVTLCYMYGMRNAGDMALNLGAIDLLSEMDGVRIIGISRFSSTHQEFASTLRYFDSIGRPIDMVGYPIDYDRNQSVLSRLRSHARGSLLYIPNIRHNLLLPNGLCAAIDGSDFVMFNGGNLLFARRATDILRLAGILYPLAYSRAIGKPYGLLPQSIPSLADPLGRRIVEHYVDASRFACFRESISLESGNWDNTEADVYPDLAFFIKGSDDDGAADILEAEGLSCSGYVPVVMRATTLGDQAHLSPGLIEETVLFSLHLIGEIRSRGLKPVLVVQTARDVSISYRVAAAARETTGFDIPVIEEYDPLTLKGLYKLAHAVITLRLHAAILSLSTGTPTIGVYRREWGPKMPGIFAEFGLAESCFDYDTATATQLPWLAFNSKTLQAIGQIRDQIEAERFRLVSTLKALVPM